MKLTPCVHCHQQLKVLHVFCVDDATMLSGKPKNIEDTVEGLKKLKLELTMEGDLADFLGVHT